MFNVITDVRWFMSTNMPFIPNLFYVVYVPFLLQVVFSLDFPIKFLCYKFFYLFSV